MGATIELSLLLKYSGYHKFFWDIKTGKNYITGANTGFAGYSVDEIADTNNFLLTIATGKSIESLNREIASLSSFVKKDFHDEFKVKGKSGEPFWLDIIGYISDSEGEKQNIICFVKNITEQRSIQSALYYSEIEKTQILDSIIDGAVFITPDLKIKYANKTFREKYPAYNTSLTGVACYKVIHNMEHPCITCSVKKTLVTGEIQKNTRTEKNGPSTLTLTYPVFDNEKKIIGAVVTFRDISESKRIEKALKKEASINKLIASLSGEILSPAIDEDVIAKKILGAALSLTRSSTGYVSAVRHESKKLEMIAFENYTLQINSDKSCVHKEGDPRCISTYLKSYKKYFLSNKLRDFVKEKGLEYCKKTRENCLMVPAFFDNKLIGQIYVAGSERPYTEEDVDMLKQLSNVYALSIFRYYSEQELIKAKNQAEESNKLKTAFLANMSHEIRTPMNSINGFIELLTTTQQPPEMQTKYLNIIAKSSNQLLDIINNILDISKLDVGQAKIKERKFNLNELILDTVESFNPDVFRENNIQLKTSLKLADVKSIVICDGQRLRQVLINLIQNAIKFTQDGFIEVGYDIENEMIKFFVKDSGIGIAKENQRIIFERFGQAESGYSRNFQGAGLGLPICKGFVELMGGEIWVESEIGKGSEFYFTIPYVTS